MSLKREKINKDQIKEIECRHVLYMPPAPGYKDDFHLVKEIIHTNDDRKVKNLRFIKNYKRDVYITKPGFRNHKQKKEWESKSRLQKISTRECDLDRRVSQALDLFGQPRSRRQLFRNPYIYGGDISSTALIKKEYINRFKGSPTPASVAVFDIETDMVDGDGRILMGTISCKDRVYTVVERKFLGGLVDVENRLRELIDIHLKEHMEKRNIKWEFMVVDTPVDIVIENFKFAHELMPDFVAIWNIDFEIPKILEACDRYNVNPADIFSDPTIPPAYRNFYYRKGPTKKKTSSGLVTPRKPSEQWHVVDTPASFQLVDAMAAFRQVRTGSQEEQSYSLDYIAEKYVGFNKLRFKEGAHLKEGSPDWHIYMQANHKLEYIVYNVFDTIIVELLDEKTQDLAFAISVYSGASDLADFHSQPRRKANELHFELLADHDKVIGTTSDQMRDEIDELTFSPRGHIVTLPAHLVEDNGLKVIKEAPDLRTNIRVAVAD